MPAYGRVAAMAHGNPAAGRAGGRALLNGTEAGVVAHGGKGAGALQAGTRKSQQNSPKAARPAICIAWGLLTKVLSAAMESPARVLARGWPGG